MSRRFKPYRRLRSEIAPLAVVLGVPLVLYAVFPTRALVSPPDDSPSAAPVASCAFVALTPEAERRVQLSARTSWQAERRAADVPRIDLVSGELPELPPHSALESLSALRRLTPTVRARYAPDLLPPTRAAEPGVRIPPQTEADETEPTFSQEELLKPLW